MLFGDLSPPLDRVGKKVVALGVSIALGVPLSIYLWQRDGPKKSSDNAVGEPRGANQEYTQNAEGNQGDERTVKGQDSNPNKFAHDEPRAMGPAKGPTSMSFKQQGLSNADTMNPYINEPGKSEKGEGETETAKLKGTVKPERPQV
ncbi:hypothetical protein N7447_004761 [Penicillium robsamsonii]|uniref:uncharacterized protein n=1 Tax=Penicillium robsamsonii TaxID=1792511 RepID=UPI00254995B1|nr:uncharacterized protein N7447_004761 [Penicillium robsamsonii]KAJ5822421.1 hypothetical protein N7447_004761 [Penicillium robsamsonii]